MIPKAYTHKLIVDGQAVAFGCKREMRKARTRARKLYGNGRIEYATRAESLHAANEAARAVRFRHWEDNYTNARRLRESVRGVVANPSRAGVMIT